MHNNIYGVIGGLGNEAMVDLARKIINIPGHERNSYILYGNSRLAYKPEEVEHEWLPTDEPELRKKATAIHTARIMQFLGCGTVGLACNSAHDLFRDVMSDVPVKFVDMIYETARSVQGVTGKVLVLGVTSLVDSGLYQTALEKYGVTAVKSSVENQKKVMTAIYDSEIGIKTAKVTPEAESLLCEVLRDECDRQGCQHVVLGCTELPLALTKESCIRFKKAGLIPDTLKIVDASSVLAGALVNTDSPSSSLNCSPQLYCAERTDWFPPVAFHVENLEEFVSIQTRIFQLTVSYLEKKGKTLAGSYMHVPTLFAVGDIPDISHKFNALTENILTVDEDWEKQLVEVLEKHFN